MFVIHKETKQIKTFNELKNEFPHVSFAFTDEGLIDFNYAILHDTAIPQLKPYEEAVSKIEEIDGKYTRKYDIVEKTFESEESKSNFVNNLKRTKKINVSQIRYNKEIEGIEFNGVRIGTDREDKGMIMGALLTAQRNNSTIRYKTKNGTFVDLDVTTLGQIYDAVSQHTQNLFNKEAEHYSAIDALPNDPVAVHNYDENNNW